MTTQFDAHGLQDLREYVQGNWNHIAVVDNMGNELLRWEVDANPNTEWISGSINNPVKAKLTVTGQDILDAGGSLPVTATLTESYQTATASTRTSRDPFTDVEIQVPEDEVVITHNFRIPP